MWRLAVRRSLPCRRLRQPQGEAVNFDTAIAVLKTRLAELDSHAGGIPQAQRREAELRSELERVRGALDHMLQERGDIIRALEELSGGVEGPATPERPDPTRIARHRARRAGYKKRWAD